MSVDLGNIIFTLSTDVSYLKHNQKKIGEKKEENEVGKKREKKYENKIENKIDNDNIIGKKIKIVAQSIKDFNKLKDCKNLNLEKENEFYSLLSKKRKRNKSNNKCNYIINICPSCASSKLRKIYKHFHANEEHHFEGREQKFKSSKDFNEISDENEKFKNINKKSNNDKKMKFSNLKDDLLSDEMNKDENEIENYHKGILGKGNSDSDTEKKKRIKNKENNPPKSNTKILLKVEKKVASTVYK